MVTWYSGAMKQWRGGVQPEREVVAQELRLLRLAAKGRVHRYYYPGLVSDAIDRGLFAGSISASREVLEGMAEKGWLVPLPATSKFMRGQWTITEAGKEEIMRLTGGRG